jgi:hypothetical protein
MSLSQDLMVLPAWLQVLVVEAHQTTCLGETKTKIYSIGHDVPCAMLILNIIQEEGIAERRTYNNGFNCCVYREMSGSPFWGNFHSPNHSLTYNVGNIIFHYSSHYYDNQGTS